jgi:putative lipoic acid-binding regulatory protein
METLTDQTTNALKQEEELQVPQGYRGSYRTLKIHPCAISIDSLRKLYIRLSDKSSEALEEHLRSINLPEKEKQQINKLKELLRVNGRLTIVIIGDNGEQILDTKIEALSQDDLPDKIASITFDSASGLKGLDVILQNSFKLNFDFTEPPSFHAYNPWNQRTPNNSTLEVSGPNTTWVSGVHETVQSFINERKKNRTWLHNQITFNVLNWLFAFPASLWVTYRVDNVFQSQFQNIHVTLRGAIYVYLVLVSLLAFRVIMAGFRWIFPVVELEGSRSIKMRAAISAVLGSPIVALFYDILKAILNKT